MSSDLLTQDLITYDPLTEVTRKERRMLLGLSVLGVALVKIPLVPEKIATLGIDFSRPNQKSFLLVYSLIVLYFLVAFLLYALTDYVAWRRTRVRRYQEYTRQRVASDVALGDAGRSMLEEKYQRAAEQSGNYGGLSYRGFASYQLAEVASWLRALFEFGLPIVFAAYSLFLLIGASRAP